MDDPTRDPTVDPPDGNPDGWLEDAGRWKHGTLHRAVVHAGALRIVPSGKRVRAASN